MQLLRTTAAALAATALVMAVGGSASAQDLDERIDNPLRLKVGGFFPYDGDTRDALGSNFISFGVGYDLRRVSSFRPMVLEAYIDGFDRSRTTSGGRAEAAVIGGGLATRFSLFQTPPSRWYNPYAGAGLGVYYTRFKAELADGNSGSATRTSIGGKFFLGTEVRRNWFGEVEFNFLPHPSVLGSDQVLSGWQLRFGYRL
jgi:hypothetical protein